MKKKEFSLGLKVKVEKFVEKVGYENNKADDIFIMEKMLIKLGIPREEVIYCKNDENTEEFINWAYFPSAKQKLRNSDPFYDGSWLKHVEDDKLKLPAREFIWMEFKSRIRKSYKTGAMREIVYLNNDNKDTIYTIVGKCLRWTGEYIKSSFEFGEYEPPILLDAKCHQIYLVKKTICGKELMVHKDDLCKI